MSANVSINVSSAIARTCFARTAILRSLKLASLLAFYAGILGTQIPNAQARNLTQSQTQSQTQHLAQRPAQLTEQASACPAALAQMTEHRVVSGDTINALAATYRLEPSTLLRFNPGIGNQLVPGSTLTIPPFNGTIVSASSGDTWQILGERYNRRADLLFEVNGCVATVPSRIFVPGAMGTGGPTATAPNAAPGTPTGSPSGAVSRTTSRELGYPLENEADIIVSYGWQPHSTRNELVFNSGIAFEIARPNTVMATAGGTVAYAGEQSGYGNLVVINHTDGLQTRYANLSDISVSVGQMVAAADTVGQVGSANEATFLYFEVRKNSAEGWVAQDPGKYVPALDLR